MSIAKGYYVLTLLVHHTFIFVDIVFNSIADKMVVRKNATLLFVLFIVQDACLLMAITCLCFNLFRTNVFKAGFVELLLYRFKGVITFAVLYLVFTVTLQSFTLILRWDNPSEYNWPPLLSAFYGIQRIFAVFFYYFYKRSILRLSDHRYYDEEWVKHAISHDTN